MPLKYQSILAIDLPASQAAELAATKRDLEPQDGLKGGIIRWTALLGPSSDLSPAPLFVSIQIDVFSGYGGSEY
jgi:hypothetical protein